jgi:hypothetical protein
MSLSAQVRSIQALEDLKGALGRFGGEAQMALQAAEQEIRRTLDWLQERLNYWRSEVQRRQEEVRQARADLASCRASGYYENDRYHAPDCSAEEHALRQAQVRLHEAEEELQNVQRWMKAVSEAVDTYRVQAQRLGRLIVTDLPKANAFLERKIAELQAYLAVAVPAGQAGAMVSAPFLQATAGVSQASETQWKTVGQPGEVQKLQDGLAALERARVGHSIAAAIREQGTAMRFGQTGEDAIAYFDPERNEIVVNEGLRDASRNVLAAHLAHEGTHVQWNRGSSVEQEYHAFKAQAEVWNELKGSEADDQCDWVSEMVSLGKEEAMGIIHDLYPDLPKYA